MTHRFDDEMKQATLGIDKDSLQRRLRESSVFLARSEAASSEISISGNEVLLVLAAAFCFAGPLVWTFIRYWLIAP